MKIVFCVLALAARVAPDGPKFDRGAPELRDHAWNVRHLDGKLYRKKMIA